MKRSRKSSLIVEAGLLVALVASSALGYMDRTSVANPAMCSEQTQRTIEQFAETMISGGPYQTFFAEDVVFTMSGVIPAIEGPAASRDAIDLLLYEQFDAQLEVRSIVAGPGHAALEATFVGTHTGEFAGVPATGALVVVPYGVFYELVDGKITVLNVYGLAEGLYQQVSAAAVAEPWNGPPTPGRPGENY